MDAVRSLAVGAAAALTVVSAYALGGGQSGATTTADIAPVSDSEAGAADGGTIALRGTGESTGVPDQLTFRLTVRAKAGDVTTALDDTGRSMRRVLSALAGADVRRRDVQTTGLSVRPDYDWSSSGPPVLSGYVAIQSVSVLVRDLRDSGAAIAAAIEAGGNAVRLSGVRLRIGDREALLAEARDAAMSQARTKAEQYATATGRTLGPVLTVREIGARGGSPVQLSHRSAALDSLAAVPVRAGSEDLKVTVAVEWSLE